MILSNNVIKKSNKKRLSLHHNNWIFHQLHLKGHYYSIVEKCIYMYLFSFFPMFVILLFVLF